MNRYLKIIIAYVLFAGLNAGMSFATVSFSDTINNPSTSGWTHILDDTDFTSNLVAGDTINVTDALLTIQMDITRYNPRGGGSLKLFEVTATGDIIFLATLPTSLGNGSALTVNNLQWLIDLDALSNAATVLQAINDNSFAIALSVGKGSIGGIDFTTLSGYADVIAPDLPTQPVQPTAVPEPGTLLLLGAGLIVMAFLGNKCMNRKI